MQPGGRRFEPGRVHQAAAGDGPIAQPGQSARLISARSVVRVHLGPPGPAGSEVGKRRGGNREGFPPRRRRERGFKARQDCKSLKTTIEGRRARSARAADERELAARPARRADGRPSDQGSAADALAGGSDEGRGKLRKAPGSRKRAWIRGCPNGGTRPRESPGAPAPNEIGAGGRTWGSEPSQYPQEEKTTVIPAVAASEPGGAQTGPARQPAGVAGPG